MRVVPTVDFAYLKYHHPADLDAVCAKYPELTVIAAAVVGGTHIMGGRGSAIGTFLGAFFLGVVRNVLILMQISSFWQQAVYGAMILAALAVDAVLARAEEGES